MSRHAPTCIKGNREQGSVLILALWVLFFLAALALAVGAHVSASLRLAGFMAQDVEGYHLARAGVTHAALQVACHSTNSWDGWSEDAWNADPDLFTNQKVGDAGYFSIINIQSTAEGMVTNPGVVGAESRLNLNRRDGRIFEQVLIRIGGAGADRAGALYKALTAYRQAKQQHVLTMRAERGYGSSRSGGDAPLESVYELLLVEGMDEDLFARILPYVTVFGGVRINANTASSELLRACAEAYPQSRDRIEEIIAQRESAPLTKSADLSSIAFLTIHSTAFYGIAVGRTGREADAVQIEFVVDSSGRRQYWHEF